MAETGLRRMLAAGAAATCLALAAAGCSEDEQPVRVAVLTECIGLLEASEESRADVLSSCSWDAQPRANSRVRSSRYVA